MRKLFLISVMTILFIGYGNAQLLYLTDWNNADPAGDNQFIGDLNGTTVTVSFTGSTSSAYGQYFSVGTSWSNQVGTNDVPGIACTGTSNSESGLIGTLTAPETITVTVTFSAAITDPILLVAYAESTYDFPDGSSITLLDSDGGTWTAGTNTMVTGSNNEFAVKYTGTYTSLTFGYTNLSFPNTADALSVAYPGTNSAPVISSAATANAAENQTSVITVTATDADACDTQTYSISGGIDQALFAIDASTGILTFVSAPDFENPGDANTDNDYLVEITVTDGAAATDVQTITVTVTNVSEFSDNNPVITSSATASAAENQTSVITVTATDADAGDTQTYSISGGIDQAKFSIVASTGVLTFVAAPDFENPGDANTDNDYLVEVTVTDGSAATDVQTITVTVTDIFENASPVITSAATANAAENQTSVITVTAIDADAGDTQTYSISGGIDQTKFSIVASTGVLTFVAAPDFENPSDANTDNDYVVEVTVTDEAAATDVQTITVTVTDVAENDIPIDAEASNLITPNGDGKNDTWFVQNINELIEYELFIFNNIGEIIYQTKAYDNSWDAKYNNKLISNGSYYYMFVNGKSVFKGTITVIR